MPSFFTDALDFDLETAGILCVFPYAALFLATLAFGRLFDRLQHAHDWSVDAVRKTAMFLSFVCCATALVIAGYLNEQYAAYALIIITQVFYMKLLGVVFCTVLILLIYACHISK